MRYLCYRVAMRYLRQGGTKVTARPQDVALLPCPFCGGVAEFDSPSVVYGVPWHSIRCCIAKAGGHDRGDVIRRWNTRANIAAALASAQAREDELRAEVERWRGHYDDMSRRAVEALDRREDAEARAERLEEALRWYANPEVYKPHPHGPAFDRRDLSFVAIAALSTNAATQTGERNG